MECQECTEEWDKSQELTVHDEEVYKERMKTVRRKPAMPWIKKEHNKQEHTDEKGAWEREERSKTFTYMVEGGVGGKGSG